MPLTYEDLLASLACPMLARNAGQRPRTTPCRYGPQPTAMSEARVGPSNVVVTVAVAADERLGHCCRRRYTNPKSVSPHLLQKFRQL
jgi:hypothetical protein